MSSPVITITPDCPATLAFQRMLENQIRRLVVVDEDESVIGIVTDRDLRTVAFAHLTARQSLAEQQQARARADDITVADVMTRDVIAVGPDTDVRDAALLMHNHKINGVPVLVGNRAVGMITVHDLMEILVARLTAEKKGATG
jgi:acetoin utilization protein AcuB